MTYLCTKRQRCPFCDRKRKKRKTCTLCGGTGKVHKWVKNKCKGIIKCPKCKKQEAP